MLSDENTTCLNPFAHYELHEQCPRIYLCPPGGKQQQPLVAVLWSVFHGEQVSQATALNA